MITATINEHAYQFAEHLTILEACRSIGIDIPTLCHDERLKPIGSCRMCLVEVAGQARPPNGLQHGTRCRHGYFNAYRRARE